MAGALVLSYLIGSIPTSLLVSRLVKGIDLRQHGSKNVGATNLYRVLGWRYAVPVGLFDMAKGYVPVAVVGPAVSGGVLIPLLCGVAAVLGHMFSPFVGFKGGKGVATGAGVVLAMAPLAFLGAFGIWALLVFLTGYVSLGSVVAAASLPLLTVWLYPDRPAVLWITAALGALVVWMHRGNIGRLLKGTESRFGRNAKETGS
ncbi:MAG: glycerol-3-phosphate 1-O-acyltransferase PlsY [Gemmatimonadetes bacterium]|nr:glycerol-3-phosphate 1-O-acyltransferase PlsY [Gemmatimonadota bacterium]